MDSFSLTLKSIGLFCTLNDSPTHACLESFGEYQFSVSDADLLNYDTFYYTTAQNHIC